MAGPSLNGPLSGWTSASLAPKTTNLPISPAAIQRATSPPGWGSVPVTAAGLAANTTRLQPKIAKAKTEAEALEKKGDQASLEAALNLRKQIAVLETGGQPHNSFELFKTTIDNFKKLHPDFQVSAENQRVLGLDFGSPENSLEQSVLGTPQPLNFSLAQSAPSSARGSSDLSKYNLSNADYGSGLVDPRAPTQRKTPLESLLASIYPDLAAGAPADPYADKRAAGDAPSIFENVLAGLGQQRASASAAPAATGSGFVAGGPSVSGPSFGANLAATIPGAPPFLAGAINGVQGFNPYAQQQARPVAAAGGTGLDLTGLAQLSAEQRIQKATLDKDTAAARAKFLASQVKQEEMRAEQANMRRLKGFSGSGWTGPALPTY